LRTKRTREVYTDRSSSHVVCFEAPCLAFSIRQEREVGGIRSRGLPVFSPQGHSEGRLRPLCFSSAIILTAAMSANGFEFSPYLPYIPCRLRILMGWMGLEEGWPTNPASRPRTPKLATKGRRMPSADRPFQCPQCRRGFRSHGRLKQHLEQHRQPRKCPNCGKMLGDNEYHRCS
jgi:hypothetical protein